MLLTIEFWEVSTFFVVATVATLVVGFFRTIWGRKGAVFHLVLCIVMILTAYVMRSVYWDIGILLEVKKTYGRLVNTGFDAFAIWGAIHGHIALHALIPEDDRDKFSIYTAWMYPPLLFFRNFLGKGL